MSGLNSEQLTLNFEGFGGFVGLAAGIPIQGTSVTATGLLSRSAGPVGGVEGGGESGFVDEFGIGGAVPAELDVFGGRDFLGAHENACAADPGPGVDEVSVGSGDFEFVESFAVAGFEAFGMGEGEADS